jgi:superfamily I DNA and RNA helicase
VDHGKAIPPARTPCRKRLVDLSGGDARAVLPDNVENDGVHPVLATGLRAPEQIVGWLAKRIVEIERFTETLPSVAVLVNSEGDVRSTAAALNTALLALNIRVVPCSDGQVMGQENDIRVFDVQHIKGMEFEAVFFIGIDQLAEKSPRLFDKYLYVGATRAATYLGLTCAGDRLPQKIAPLQSNFVDNWSR